MEDYQKKFLELSLKAKVLEFGDFALKSGRQSPYFFNAARMLDGGYLYELADCYKQAIEAANLKFDCIYGPCLLYTSPSPRDRQKSRMPSSA